MSTNTSTSLQIKVSNRGVELSTHHFSDDVIYIGRDPESDVFLDNQGVSRRHAKIQRTDAGFQIIDLQSGNGTFVNEKKVVQALLNSGDVIRISKFTIELDFSDYIFEPELFTHKPEAGEKTQAPVEIEVDSGETIFLRPGEQVKVLEQAKQAERDSELIKTGAQPPQERKRSTLLLLFLAGTAFGILLLSLFSD
jgi:pSer/pThr/pTyr-binding forkhead associated (FHA) protein